MIAEQIVLPVSPADHPVCRDVPAEDFLHRLSDLAHGAASSSADDGEAKLKFKISFSKAGVFFKEV